MARFYYVNPADTTDIQDRDVNGQRYVSGATNLVTPEGALISRLFDAPLPEANIYLATEDNQECDDAGNAVPFGDGGSLYYVRQVGLTFTGTIGDAAARVVEAVSCAVRDKDTARDLKEAERSRYALQLLYANAEITRLLNEPGVPGAAANWRVLLNEEQLEYWNSVVRNLTNFIKDGDASVWKQDVPVNFLNTNTNRENQGIITEPWWRALQLDVGFHNDSIIAATDAVNDDINQFYQADDPAGIALINVHDPAYGWPLAWGINDGPEASAQTQTMNPRVVAYMLSRIQDDPDTPRKRRLLRILNG